MPIADRDDPRQHAICCGALQRLHDRKVGPIGFIARNMVGNKQRCPGSLRDTKSDATIFP